MILIDFSTGRFLAGILVCHSMLSIIFFSKFRIVNLLNPFVTAHAVLMSIFGLRPLVMRYPKDFEFYGLDAVTGFNRSVAAGLIASFSLTVGFCLSHPSIQRVNKKELYKRNVIVKRARMVSISLIFLWATLMIYIGGTNVLSLLSQGRSEELNSKFAGVPILLQTLPASSFIIFSVSLFVLGRNEKISSVEAVQLVTVFLVTATPSALVGDRRIIFPMTVCLLMVLFQNHRDLRLGVFSFFGFLVVGLIFIIFPYVRSSGAREGVSLPTATYQFFRDNGIVEVVRSFLVKNDTEMFNFVSFLTVQIGNEFQYGYGRGTFVDLFREALPSSLSASHTWSDMILTKMFGGGCGAGLCPVPSLVGVLFYDTGFLGIMGGFLFLGYFARKYDVMLNNFSGLKLVFTFTVGAYCAVIVRGSSIAIFWIALNVILIGYLGLKFVFGKIDPNYEGINRK